MTDLYLHRFKREDPRAWSARRLAAELEAEAPSLYRPSSDDRALLDSMVEVLLSGVRVTDEEVSWEERVRAFAVQVQSTFTANVMVGV